MSSKKSKIGRFHPSLFTAIDKLRLDWSENGDMLDRVKASERAARILEESRINKPSRRNLY